MAYNLTNLTNGGTLLSVFQVANEVTEGWFGIMILLSTFTISFVSLMQVSDKKMAFAASSFLTFIITILLRAAELIVDDKIFILAIVLVVGSAIILHATD
jgi:hypothetical protein